LVLVDQAAITDDEAARLFGDLLRRHGDPSPILLTRALPAVPLPATADAIPWQRVLRRPASIGELVAAVQTILPLPPGSGLPLD
ncbi:MAG: hypothetical protein ACREM9_00170, partial [Gemmatimonadales bacterium]